MLHLVSHKWSNRCWDEGILQERCIAISGLGKDSCIYRSGVLICWIFLEMCHSGWTWGRGIWRCRRGHVESAFQACELFPRYPTQLAINVLPLESTSSGNSNLSGSGKSALMPFKTRLFVLSCSKEISSTTAVISVLKYHGSWVP